uniref:Kinetochore protein Nuf2 N-terminal domain-containing protein n=1 Tax=Anopheles christyi TaxID=43041 RepID=A0A182JS44_9DIPT
MSNTAFIDDWNSIIPFKIKATDLEKPTEQFVYKSILQFFKLMHYDVSSYENMYNESNETLTMKRVELVARINYIYQLCSDSKQTSFFYVDLVKPTGKKIIHLLKVLLNYLFYINMVKETVLEKANNCAEECSELNAKLNQEQIMKEENKIRASKINRHIDDLKSQLPQLMHQIETLQHRKHTLQENISTLKANNQHLADKIIKLKINHSELTEQIVADDEASSVRATKLSLNSEIEKLTEQEKELQQTYQIHVSSINNIRPCNALMEKLLQFGIDDSCKNLRCEIAELNSLYDKLQKRRTNLTNIYDGLQKNCEELEVLVGQKNQELQVRRRVLEKNGRKNDNKHLDKEKRLKALEQTHELYEQFLVAQRAEMQEVIDMVEKSIDFIK